MTRLDRRSEAQANAEAAHRRDHPFTQASGRSFDIAWDRASREPRTLKEYVHALRRAYTEGVPSKLHEGPDSIDGGGTPRYSGEFAAYLFGDAQSTDQGDPENLYAVEVYRTPFRACLAWHYDHRDEQRRQTGKIVAAIAIGGSAPSDAVTKNANVGYVWSEVVARSACRTFWRSMSNVRLTTRRQNVTEPLVSEAAVA